MTNNKRFSRGEELANAISHGSGTVISIVGLVLLIIIAVRYGGSRHIVSSVIFGTTMVILYLSSTLNHALSHGKWKDFFHNFDQVAIFLLIAGTYTPLALVALHNDWGWLMFGLQWGFALSGIIIKLFTPNRFEKGVNIFFILAYIVMGWMLLFFLFPIIRNLDTRAFYLILGGGAFYTLGTIFFNLKKVSYAHLVWHLFVIGGSVCHWIAIIKYVLPMH